MQNGAINVAEGETKLDPQIIQGQLSTTTRHMFPYEPKSTEQMQLLTRSIKEEDIKNELSKIFRMYPQPYVQLQIPQEQIEEIMMNSLYCFIIQAVIGSEIIGYAFCGLDSKNT
jgi:hypothetical protein